jgi:chlorobactene glucosyltransferase
MTTELNILLIFAFIPLVIMFLTATINAAFGPFLKKKYSINKYPKVSVLIPARNEEKNIRNCLQSIYLNDYPDFEVIVLDDNSTDDTLDIIRDCSAKYHNIKYLEGSALPEGWLGKTWACHQLSEKAEGEILIFTDADNTYNTKAILNTVGYIDRFKLDFLSAFPEQKTRTFAEKLIVPMIDLIAYSFFILWSSYFVKFSIFIEANGQWLAVKRKSYLELNGHQSVKDKIVEDTELGRIFKKNKKRTMTVAGSGIVFGKMYDSFREIWQGLSKNLFGIAGYNSALFFTLVAILACSTLLPYSFIFIHEYILLFALIVNLIWRAILSLRFNKSSFITSMIFHPISVILFVGIAINSYFQSIRGTIEWKGRKIDPGIRYDKK